MHVWLVKLSKLLIGKWIGVRILSYASALFLALGMIQRFFYLLFPIILLLSCSNENEDQLLTSPPYDLLTDSIRQSPGKASLYYNRGKLLFANKQEAYAEKDLRKAWELEASEPHAVGMFTILDQKHKDSVFIFLQEAVKKVPGSIALKIELAKRYQERNQFNEALSLTNQVLQDYPGEINAAELKYDVLSALDREAEGIATLEAAHAYKPDDVALTEKLAFAYAETKNSKVLQLADSLIRVDVSQKHAEPYFAKGVYYSNIGRYNDAIREFDEAIRHDFLYMSSYINKAIVYYEQKKYREALGVLELAIRVDPTYAESYYWTGKTLEASGNMEEARINYERAYQLDKSHEEAREAAARLKSQ